MKKALYFLALLVVACGGPPEADGGTITSSGGVETIEELLKEDSVKYDLSKEPTSVQLFFELTNAQIGDEYCYNEEQVKNLIMGSGPDEYTWTSKEAHPKYLVFVNDECYTTTEFILKGKGENQYGILLQTSKNGQKMDVFERNDADNGWTWTNYPKPEMTEFYNSLGNNDANLVNEFGFYSAVTDNFGGIIKFMFSTWQMGLNADGKEIMDFNQEPDFSFDLMYDSEKRFSLKKVIENEDITPKRYFLAYSETPDVSEDYLYFSEQIAAQLEDYGVEFNFAVFNKTDNKGIFSKDTFDFSYMEQFESRTGYWFFERGKEPLDLPYDMVGPTVDKAKEYFDEN